MDTKKSIKASILICTLNREESLNRLLRSLRNQNCQDFEVLICREKGNLVELKDKLWRKAQGEILIWMDDDVVINDSGWINRVLLFFRNKPAMVGYCSRAFVPLANLNNRDIFKYRWIHSLYSWLFVDGMLNSYGYISRCGVNSIGGDNLHCWGEPADFLEPSAFALRRSAVETVDGFDLNYKGVGEWCDVDLCYRVKKYGYLLYDGLAYVTHYPERDGIANQRLETKTRYENYLRFSEKFIKKTPRHYLYRAFLKSYFFGKQKGWF